MGIGGCSTRFLRRFEAMVLVLFFAAYDVCCCVSVSAVTFGCFPSASWVPEEEEELFISVEVLYVLCTPAFVFAALSREGVPGS